MTELKPLFREQYVGLPFADDSDDCKIFVFPDIENTIVVLRVTSEINYLYQYIYTNGVWKQSTKLKIDGLPDVVFPLSGTEVVIGVGNDWEFHNLTLADSTYGHYVCTLAYHTYVSDDVLCRLSKSRFALVFQNTLNLYKVDEETGFTLLSSLAWENKFTTRLFACDGATFMYAKEGSTGIINVIDDVLNQIEIKKQKCFDILPLTSTSYLAFVRTDTEISFNYYDLSFERKNIANFSTGYHYHMCKLSATSVIVQVDGEKFCYIFSNDFGEWKQRKFAVGIEEEVMQLKGINVDNSFVFSSKSTDQSSNQDVQQIVVYRQKKEVKTKLMDVKLYAPGKIDPTFNNMMTNIYNIEAFSINLATNELLILDQVLQGNPERAVVQWTVVDLSIMMYTYDYDFKLFTELNKEVNTRKSIKKYIIVHPFIVVYHEEGFSFYNYKSGKFYGMVPFKQSGRVEIFVLTFAIVAVFTSVSERLGKTVHVVFVPVPLLGPKNIDRVKEETFPGECYSGFSDKKESLVLCHYYKGKQTQLRYYHENINQDGLDLKQTIKFKDDDFVSNFIWDGDPGSLNFLYQVNNTPGVHPVYHAVLNPDNSFTCTFIKKEELKPKQEFYMYGQLKNIKKCVKWDLSPSYMHNIGVGIKIDDHRILTFQVLGTEPDLSTKLSIELIECCIWTQCIAETCTQPTHIFGTLCESCESAKPLRESRCEVLSAQPTCVPRLEKYVEKHGMQKTTLPKGTLLFHSTKATPLERQDPAKPRHRVFYEQKMTPKSHGVVYFCVNPWISLTEHFYHRQPNQWNNDGAYSKLISNNVEREIMINAVDNGRPGAICVYRTTQELVLFHTDPDIKRKFCKKAKMLCKGDNREYENNDFGLVCFALQKGLDGFISIDENDTINHCTESHCLHFKNPVTTEFISKTQSSMHTVDDIPFREINGHLYTWEIVLTEFESKMELVTWIDAGTKTNAPIKPTPMYKMLKTELQASSDTNIWDTYLLQIKLMTSTFTLGHVYAGFVYMNIDFLFHHPTMNKTFDFDKIEEDQIRSAVQWFAKDVLASRLYSEKLDGRFPKLKCFFSKPAYFTRTIERELITYKRQQLSCKVIRTDPSPLIDVRQDSATEADAIGKMFESYSGKTLASIPPRIELELA